MSEERKVTWSIVAKGTKAISEFRRIKKAQDEVDKSNEQLADSDKAAAKAAKERAKSSAVSAEQAKKLAEATKAQADANKKLSSSLQDVRVAEIQVAATEKRATEALKKRNEALAEAEAAISKYGDASDEAAAATNALAKAQRESAAADRARTAAVNAMAVATRKSAEAQHDLTTATSTTTSMARGHDASLRDNSRSMGALSRASDGLKKALGGVGQGFGVLLRMAIPMMFVGIVAAIQPLIGILSSLTAGAVAVVGPLWNLVYSLAAVPQMASVAVGALATLLAGFSGIGGALKAFGQQQGKASAASKAGAAAMDQQAQKARALEQAKWNLAKAQLAVTRAQEALTKARIDAKRAIEDLAAAEANRRLDAEGAALAVERAKQNLDQVMADPGSSVLDKREADLAYREALQRQQDLAKEQARIIEDTNREDRKGRGVEGSPEVVAAQEALKDAQKSLKDAKRAVKDAQKAFKTAGASAGASVDKFAEAMAKLPKPTQAFVRQLLSMRGQLDAIKQAASAGLFAGLASDGRQMGSLLGMFKRLEGSSKFWKIINTSIQDFGAIIGDAGERLATFLTSAEGLSLLESLSESNKRMMGLFAQAILNTVEALLNLMVAAEPFTEWVGEAILGWTEFWKETAKAGRETGAIADRLDYVKWIMQSLGRTIKNWVAIFRNIGKAGKETGDSLVLSWEELTASWAEWTGDLEGQNQLKEWFTEARAVLREVSAAFGQLTRGFFDLGRDGGLDDLIRKIRLELFPAIGRIVDAISGAAGASMLDSIINIADAFANMLESGGGGVLGGFLKGIEGLTAAFEKLTQIPGFNQLLFGIGMALAGWAALKFTGLLAAGKAISKIVKTRKPKDLDGGDGGKKKGGLLSKAKSGAMGLLGGKAAAGGAGKAASGVGKLVTSVGGLAKLAGPIGLIISLAMLLISNWDKVVERLSPVFKELKGAFGEFLEAINFDGIMEASKPVFDFLGMVFGWLEDIALDAIIGAIKGVVKIITGAIKIVTGIINIVKGIFTGDLSTIGKGFGQIFEGIWNILTGAIANITEMVGGAMSRIFGDAWEGAKAAVKQWGTDFIVEPFRRMVQAVKDFLGIESPSRVFMEIGNNVIAGFKNALTAGIGVLRSAWNFVKGVLTWPIEQGRIAIAGIWGRIKSFGVTSLTGIRTAFSTTWNKVTEMLVAPVRAGKNLIDTAWTNIKNAFTNGWAKIKAIGDKIGGVFDGGKEALRNTVNWVIGGANKILGALNIKKLPTWEKKARGGTVGGYGNRDSVPALLMPGEFVMRRSAVDQIGVQQLHAMNEGRTRRGRRFEKGGAVGGAPGTGGWGDSLRDAGSSAWNAIKSGGSKVLSVGGKILDIAKEGATKAAELLINPVKAQLSDLAGKNGFVSDMVKGGFSKAFSEILSFIRKKDDGSAGGPKAKAGAYGPITSNYGMRTHPITGKRRMHTGTDFGMRSGTPIGAAAAGKVTSSGQMGGYGKAAIVSHGGGYSTLYAHMSAYGAKRGSRVAKGSVVGRVGSTGNSTGPHLHLEVRKNGRHQNPMGWLRRNRGGPVPTLLTPGEMVMSRATTQAYGVKTLTKMNRTPHRYALGGLVGKPSARPSGSIAGALSAGRSYAGAARGRGDTIWAPVINNPVPEKASDSLVRAARKVTYLGLGGLDD